MTTSNADMLRIITERRVVTRRTFLSASATGLGLGTVLGAAPAIVVSAQQRPRITSGVQSGDVTRDRALVWSRTDRPARMVVRYATTPALAEARIRRSDPTGITQDFTARVDLGALPPGQRIF